MAAHLPHLLGLTLVRNGGYARHFRLVSPEKSWVYRKRCPGCRLGFSLLPRDIAPLHTYPLALVVARLSASSQGRSDRSREFYESQGLIPDDFVDKSGLKGASWSDQLEDYSLRPSPQLFRLWRQKWSAQSQLWLQFLLFACILAGCDIKTSLGFRLDKFGDCSMAMRPLVICAGLVSLIREESVDTALRTAVQMLSFSPSHKTCRAPGRAPPQYGGDLDYPGTISAEVFRNESIQ